MVAYQLVVKKNALEFVNALPSKSQKIEAAKSCQKAGEMKAKAMVIKLHI